jgi:hypothetical protein
MNVDSANVCLTAEDGGIAWLRISQLPSSRHSIEAPPAEKLVVLREARVYRYELLIEDSVVLIQPSELFDPDDTAGRSGRLTPGEAVGLVTVAMTTSTGRTLRGRFEVRSAKFSDEGAFATMLADLAALSVEALHQGFAPAAGQFSADAGATPRLLYQQFAVLHALLNGSDLVWAISQVLSQPHRAWIAELEPRRPGQPLRGSSRLSTQLSRPGPRVPAPHTALVSLPAELLVSRTEETLDTVPNRYVRFVLERWRALAFAVVDGAGSLHGAPQRRGLQEAQRVVEMLDGILGDPLFREVGPLSVLPGDNQVLRRREGYRQIAGAAAFVDGSLGLELDLEDPFLVSRRSIATLYEYWTFVRLAEAVARACGSRGVMEELFKPSPSGMSLVLKAGASTRLKFEANVGGTRVLADLFFNREFRSDSWTRPMRPDASLVVRVPGDREVWLHFDAKYKVDWSLPFQTGEPDDEEAAERSGTSKRTDLLKMHAYRDAIRSSAGSYVLFPGSEVAEFSVNDAEFLPGLGAFPLRPEHAEADADRLEAFVERVLRHVAGQGTRHRRASHWETKAYSGPGTDSSDAVSPAGDLPPADTSVLMGYVRSEEQWAWIRQARLYNVRSGDRPGALGPHMPELDAPLLLLYGTDAGRDVQELYRRRSGWHGITADAILRLGYPHPRGSAYLVASIERLPEPAWLMEIDPHEFRPKSARPGQPFSISWLDLVLATQGEGRP